jgi:hypothetical protein
VNNAVAMSRLYPKPIFYSVEAEGELVAEYLDRDEALALAKLHDDSILYAHGRYEGAACLVFWEVTL